MPLETSSTESYREDLVSSGVVIKTEELAKADEMGSEQVHALRGVDVDIRDGEYVAIMGPSGSGKSTLMNLIGCLDTPTSGKYWLDGQLVSSWTTTSWRTSATRKSASFSRPSTCCRAPPRCTTWSCR